MEYVRKKESDHLAKTLKKHHTISQDWEGEKFSGIDLTWTYAPNHAERTCRLSMKNYIANLLVALNHPAPKSHSCPLTNVGKSRTAARSSTITRRTRPLFLTPPGIRRVQQIVGANPTIAKNWSKFKLFFTKEAANIKHYTTGSVGLNDEAANAILQLSKEFTAKQQEITNMRAAQEQPVNRAS